MDIRDLIKRQHEKFLKVAKFMPGTPSSFADNLDKAYIKGLTDMKRYINFIDEEKLNLLADDYVIKLDEGGGAGCYDDITIQEAYKAGYRKAKEEYLDVKL